MGRRKQVGPGGWKRMGSKVTDARMKGQGSNFYKGRRVPLEESLALAAINTTPRPPKSSPLGLPKETVRVVPASAVPVKPKRKCIPLSVGAKTSAKAIRPEFPPRPTLERPEPLSIPKQAKPQSVAMKPKPETIGAAVKKGKKSSRVPPVLLGQRRFEGGIVWVQGGLPFQGKR